MANKKAAIQMSLGLIVAVIFAVVFLSLAIVWVNDFMKSISGWTDDLLQEGRQKIKEIFSETDQKFAVYPPEWELERGKALKMVAGIINKEDDSAAHSFVINVIPTKPETATWIDESEFNTPLTTQFNKIQDFPITITPPSDTPAGTYVFYVIACMTDKIGYSGKCEEHSDANYESAQYFRLTLK